MTTYRLPILVWRDVQGGYTAASVEPNLGEPTMVGVADTPSDAIRQVRSYVNWILRKEPWLVPDFHDPSLLHVRVSVRPEYRAQKRVYPCPEQIDLQIPCVVGHQQSGLLLCSMPTLGMSFHFFDRKELRPLVAETVRRALSRRTPQELARFLPPESCVIEHVSVRIPETIHRPVLNEGPALLSRVAQALGQTGFRKRFSHLWKRDREMRDLVQRLGTERANVLLVGKRGSGKTSILVHAVRTLERDRAKAESEELPTRHRYWQTNAGRLVAGMKYLGQWEERVEQAISELSSMDGVLCLESLRDLMLLGGAGTGSSVAAFFQSYLRDGQLRMVVEATPEELEAGRHLLPGFVDLFQVLRLEDLTDAEARDAVHRSLDLRARDAKLSVEEHLGDHVFHLYRRFLPYHPLPGAASGFLSELFDRARADRIDLLTASRTIDQFTRETGLPSHLIRDDCPLDVDALEQELCGQVIGQQEACRVMVDVIARFKTGLNDPRRPLSVLLFCGPTGVGKTQLARTVAQYLFGHGRVIDRLVRLDMSEYSSPYAVDRLTTKEDGSSSEFVSRVRQQPFSVVLLDEIEKAAAEVYDVLLSVLDDGRLTDRFGRVTTFHSSVVIMTSNLGATARNSLGLRPQTRPNYEMDVRAFFRPEFFNRLDQLVTFQPLERASCRAIIRKEVAEISNREGLRQSRIQLHIGEALAEHLLHAGFDVRFGARPLQRTLESLLVAPLARFLINHPTLQDVSIHAEHDADHGCQFTIS